MPKMIALLRGINVGGKNKIKMAELRSALEEAELKNVETYIQSGNIIFDSKSASRSKLESQIHELIEQHFGWDVPVMVRPKAFFADLIKNNPFPKSKTDFLHATILSKAPAAKDVSEIASQDFGDDEFKIVKDVVYIYCPGSYHKTKISNTFFEKKLSRKATTRNWRTLNKLVELSGAKS